MIALTHRPGVGWVVSAPSTPKIVSQMKELGGSRMKEVWVFPEPLLYACNILRTFKEVEISETAKVVLEGRGFEIPKIKTYPHPRWGDLLPHQVGPIEFLLASPFHGSLLASSPGLGKTIMVILAAQIGKYENVLILAPKSLLLNWQREIRAWGGSDARISRKGAKDGPLQGWVITNYDTLLRNDFSAHWDLIVLDESIMVKNPHAKRFKVLEKLCSNAKKVWELSGSPISRMVDDLYAQFKLLEPGAFRSYWRFAKAYCVVVDGSPWSMYKVMGSRNDIDYQSEFRDLMYVQSQEQVLDLPEVLAETISLDLVPEQKKVYDEILEGLIRNLKQGDMSVPNKMAEIVRLQQVISNTCNFEGLGDNSSKSDALMELLEFGEIKFPLLIWVHWRGTAKAIYARLVEAGYNVGLVSGESKGRQEILDAYTRGEIEILVLSLGVGKFGLTLTNTETVVYMDHSFAFDDFVQSFFRVKRIGLTHTVAMITLSCPGTIEDLVTENLGGKAVDLAKIASLDLIDLLEQSHK